MIYAFAKYVVDTDRFELLSEGQPVEIEPKVLDLIVYLLQNSGRLVSKDELHTHLWQGRVVSDAALSSLVRDARKVLGDGSHDRRIIETLYGRGFRFAAEVEERVLAKAEARKTLSDQATAETVTPAIAVLPFDNLSGDTANDTLADGITEELITGLSRFRWFTVIARNSVFPYRGKARDARAIGEELGVDYLVEGSVIREGERVRVHVQLIGCEGGQHVWAERYDLVFESLFALLDEITTLLVGRLQPELIESERRRAERTAPNQRTAWHLFVQAQNLLAAPDRNGNALARAMLLEAVAHEPDSARVHAGIALTHLWDIVFAWNPNAADALAGAFQSATRAVAVGQSDSWAWSALGACKLMLRNHAAACEDHRRAIEADPNSALAEGSYALTLAFSGELDEALVAAARAERLSPTDRRSALWQNAIGIAEFGLGRFDRALAAGQRTVASRPDYIAGHRLVAASAANLGQSDLATEACRRIRQLSPAHLVETEVAKLPFRRLDQASAYATALRLAGLD
jgi:TolB-like protein/Flp pilus assembly protein TadD